MSEPLITQETNEMYSCWFMGGLSNSRSQTLWGLQHKAPSQWSARGSVWNRAAMMMSSVWITLGSQTHVRSRLHLPLLFASTPYPLMTSWRSARLYIMSDTEDSSAVHEKSSSYQPSWSSCVRYMHWIPSVLVFVPAHWCIFSNLLKTNPLSVLFTSYYSPPWKLVPGKILLALPEWMFAKKT